MRTSLLKKSVTSIALALMLALPMLAMTTGSAAAGRGGPAIGSQAEQPSFTHGLCNVPQDPEFPPTTYTHGDCTAAVLDCENVGCIISTLDLQGCTSMGCIENFVLSVYGLTMSCGSGQDFDGGCTMIVFSIDGKASNGSDPRS